MTAFRATAAKSDSFSDYSSDEELSLGTSHGANQTNEMNTTQKDQVKEVQDMAKRETQQMEAWKCVVTVTVVVTALIVSAGTFIFLAGEENSAFHESYESLTNTIGDAEKVHKYNLISTMKSFSNIVSAAATAKNNSFPFVTIPIFEVLAESALQQSQSELLMFTPKVEVDEVTRWQEYATANEGWYEESKQLAISSSEGRVVQSDFAAGSPLPFIYNTIVDEDGNSTPGPPRNPPFYPIWQVSPPPFSPFLMKANIGGVPEFLSSLEAADMAKEGVMGHTFFSDQYGLTGLSSKADGSEGLSDKFMLSKPAGSRPHAFFTQPIFHDIYDDTSEVVGYINALVPWDIYFANLLPEGAKVFACVVSNTCGQNFTYFLEGNNVSRLQLANECCPIPWVVETKQTY
jgi:hypothetical protein